VGAFNEAKLLQVGIWPDGTLWNPNGYPDDIVRTAVLEADERKRIRRSDAAKKAAETRRERRDKKVYAVAKRIGEGGRYGPRQRCMICSKGLVDQHSIDRGSAWHDLRSCESRRRWRRSRHSQERQPRATGFSQSRQSARRTALAYHRVFRPRLQSTKELAMVETRYKSASGPDEIIAKRQRNSGGLEADHTIKSGEGVRRVYHNIHLSGHQAQHGGLNKGEGDIRGATRGPVR
jgi:hypothetical protein